MSTASAAEFDLAPAAGHERIDPRDRVLARVGRPHRALADREPQRRRAGRVDLGRLLDVAGVERHDAVVTAADDPHGLTRHGHVGGQLPGGQARAVDRDPRLAREQYRRCRGEQERDHQHARQHDRPLRQALHRPADCPQVPTSAVHPFRAWQPGRAIGALKRASRNRYPGCISRA